jgi:glutamate 5-kinase
MAKNLEIEVRKHICSAQRIVIKVGTRVLTDANGRPEELRIKRLAEEISRLHQEGREVMLVTSGAIGRGLELLGRDERPKQLPDLQMAAAIGQVRLMSQYQTSFSEHGIDVAQILLTHDDFQDRKRHLNIRNTINRLFVNKVLPIVNENDVVSVDEIKLGDNDQLAALSAVLINADALVLLSTVEGFLKPNEDGQMQRVSYLSKVTSSELRFAGGTDSKISTGGMNTKLSAAQILVDAGGCSIIADGRSSGILGSIFSGEDAGTLIGLANADPSIRKDKKRWLAVFQRSQGKLTLDDGATKAIAQGGKSLLPAGIVSVEGNFERGDLVDLLDSSSTVFARGLVDYSSREIERIKGLKSSEIEAVLGERFFDVVISRDNLVVLNESQQLKSDGNE